MAEGIAPIYVQKASAIDCDHFAITYGVPPGTEEVSCEVMMVGDDDDEAYYEGVEAYFEDGDGSDSDDEDPLGLCILDTACRKTMHAAKWRRRYLACLHEFGLPHREEPTTQRFRCVGGSTTARSSDTYPCGIAGVNGEIESCLVPDKSGSRLPLPLSLFDLQRLWVHLHTVSMTVDFDALGVKNSPLIVTSKGHLAVILLDFDQR